MRNWLGIRVSWTQTWTLPPDQWVVENSSAPNRPQKFNKLCGVWILFRTPKLRTVVCRYQPSSTGLTWILSWKGITEILWHPSSTLNTKRSVKADCVHLGKIRSLASLALWVTGICKIRLHPYIVTVTNNVQLCTIICNNVQYLTTFTLKNCSTKTFTFKKINYCLVLHTW